MNTSILLGFKQAWGLIRQERLFSSIYIIGTGLSVTVVMVLSILFYVKTAGIYPETNRDRLLIARNAAEFYEGGGMSSSHLSYRLVETCFRSLESAEAVSMIRSVSDEAYVQPAESKQQLKVVVKYTDNPFWTVFPFHFTDGRPFSEEEVQSGIYTAVIAESFARRLFGKTTVSGEYVSLNFRPYRICGVVKDASYVTERTFAHLWVPYSVIPDYKETFGEGGSLGQMQAYILAPSAGEVGKVRQEALGNVQRHAQALKETDKIALKLYGQPDRQAQSVLREGSGWEFNPAKEALRYGLILFVLLLVPAVSLSGMTESRMERRLAEMGVRRAFGARKGTLIRQILSENMLFTLAGGVIGLLFSYLVLILGSSWLILLGSNRMAPPPAGVDVVFTPSMLFNPNVCCITLGICLLLNVLSALIPAWRASRREIVYSLLKKYA
jgi:putative ABC transport system permease protein